MLFYLDPESFVKQKRGGRKIRKAISESEQLLLFDDL
jgi:hypothetical protein